MSLQSFELTPEQKLPQAMPPYGISARFFCNLYSAFGIETTESLRQFTYGVCSLARIVDDAVDFPDVTTPQTFDQLISSLRNGDRLGAKDSDIAVALNYVDALHDDQLAFAEDVYRGSLEAGAIRASAKRTDEYIAGTTQEASAQFKALAISEDPVYRDAGGRKQYNRWLKQFALTGYLVDSALDMPSDYLEGRTQVPPTTRARLTVLAHSVRPAVLASKLLPPRALPLLGGLAVAYHIPLINHRYSDEADLPRKAASHS